VDRDGEHFGHVLEYMRDRMVAVAHPSVKASVSLLRALKREFGSDSTAASSAQSQSQSSSRGWCL
jgi:hypothetical protein